MTVRTTQRHVTRVRVRGQVFPVGHAVEGVADETIEALKAMPGVTVDVAGIPDADAPAPEDEE